MSKYGELEDWGLNSLRSTVNNPRTLDELDNQKNKYDGMTRKQKREADWKSQEITGETNEERYNRLKSSLSRADIHDDENIEIDYSAAQTVSESVANFDFSKYYVTTQEIDNAKQWATEAIRVIIYPTNTLPSLEELYINFKSQIRKHQREADWKSMEVFGIDNETHYQYLKSKYSINEITPEEEAKSSDKEDNNNTIVSTEAQCRFIKKLDIEKDQKLIIEGCMSLISKNKTFYEDKIVATLIDDTIELFDKNVAQITDDIFIPYLDMPFYDPEEMMALGIHDKEKNLFKAEASNKMIDDHYTTRDWFEAYTMNFNGFYTKNMHYMNECRINKLLELYNDYKNSPLIDEIINPIKQSILELGWNPNIPFDSENRSYAYNKMVDKLHESGGITSVIDISHYNDKSHKIVNSDVSGKNGLHPIYIVLVEGVRLFSDMVKRFTNSRFSHAAIGFESSLKNLYSFNADNAVNKNGGFSIESIEKYNKDKALEVFTIFVKDKEYKSIRKFVDEYANNQTKTSYSAFNVLSILFNIPINRNMSMICSQFVDRLLKLANIDITNKDSSLVNPGDFERVSYTNKKIYKIFDNKVKEYKQNKIDKQLDRMIAYIEPIKELFLVNESTNTSAINSNNFIEYLIENIDRIEHVQQLDTHKEFITNPYARKFYDNVISHYVYAKPVCEVKEFPIQFNKEGDLLIKNFRKINLNNEYNNSNKLLKIYAEEGNINGLKYELCKLQFIKDILDSRVYPNGEKDNNIDQKLVNLRAVVINDFKRYLRVVMKEDKTFNFSKCYQESPFDGTVAKINSHTLKYTIDLLKTILK